MSSDLQQIRIGLTDNHPCSYLPNRQERVAVALEPALHSSSNYEVLLANGFRRSGDTIYKPHCELCSACQPIRISVPNFEPSRSQKRLLAKAKTITYQLKEELDNEWFELYNRYIEVRHRNGSMYPANRDSFAQFSHCTWLNTQYLHIYDNGRLIGIAVTDILSNSASAFYTFFDPHSEISLGTLGVLLQIDYCRNQGKQWLYLGYQIDECSAMNYKVRFQPHQRLVNQTWQG
ncbi:Arginyltransferase [Vibrio scophthalmi]|uniref:Aspartate/glutamate leucyltransferase n=1 Tax=Vibrio scophthalmi LMG 19158 TaxID=870967 RepID=F9RVM1_9VIBR|nr:arginyltransferase [Vibrio scophthalmi]ANS85960.1 Arginyltransferase [Vibrio scophthalmi]EGU29320.1 arginyl-tRNA-protein transferase [Vibrio scophthalmi LMG 19158]